MYGLADCNPYGVSVLNSYHYQQVATQRNSSSNNGNSNSNSTRRRRRRNYSRKSFQIQWIGLRPSQVQGLGLPASCFQQMTDRDKRQLTSLTEETHPFHQRGLNPNARMQELEQFQQEKKKVELEALNWKGMDFLCRWVYTLLRAHEQEVEKHEQHAAAAAVNNHHEEEDDSLGNDVNFEYHSII